MTASDLSLPRAATRTLVALAVAAPLLLVPARRAAAQVGYTPEHSPYRDVEWKQQLTLFSGSYQASRDPAGVAPQSAPLVGVRYDLRLGGPADLTVRAAHTFSDRTVIDPRQPAGSRVVGTTSAQLNFLDVGIALNLTGARSWHSLIPVVQGGLGVATDFKGGQDVGGFRIGTPFAVSLGAGVRWVPRGSRFQLRADVGDYLFAVSYPSTYFTPPTGGGNAVLKQGASKSSWQHNGSFTLGISYLFLR